MKRMKLFILLGALAIAGWGCSNSPTRQQPERLPYPPDAITHLPPESEMVASDSVYRIIPDSLLTNQQKKLVADLLNRNKYYISVHLARYNENAETLLKQADTLAFPISEDTAYVAVKNYSNISMPDNDLTAISWDGIIPPNSGGQIHLSYLTQGSGSNGHIAFKHPFIVGVVLENIGHNMVAVIQAKNPPFYKVIQ